MRKNKKPSVSEVPTAPSQPQGIDWLAAAGLTIAFVTGLGSLYLTRASNEITAESNNLTKESNRITAEATFTANRPWLTISPGTLTPRDEQAGQCLFQGTWDVTNTGNVPALNVKVDAGIITATNDFTIRPEMFNDLPMDPVPVLLSQGKQFAYASLLKTPCSSVARAEGGDGRVFVLVRSRYRNPVNGREHETIIYSYLVARKLCAEVQVAK